ncbi:DUF2510 domain-containing protein [Kitasatospora sp. NPDC056731]|uniref:DUF2510 domain-containing protein n=1 Tax=Kitasatospora sp. NPDC056731 TaxID=3155422 RepID=UPI00342586A8
MSEQIPAGWYPDPKDTGGDPRPQRWWDGRGWTASTRPAPSDAPEPVPPATGAPGPVPADEPTVLQGEVLDSGPTVRYPEPPPFGTAYGSEAPPPRKPRRRPSPMMIAATVAALLGLGTGSGITFLAMDGQSDNRPQRSARQAVPNGENGPWNGFPGLGGNGNGGSGNGGNGNGGSGNGNNGNGGNNNGGSGDGSNGTGGNGGPGGNGGSGGNGNGGSGKARPGAGNAIDLVNGLTLPVPSGWQGGYTNDGYASVVVGSYQCPDGNGLCSLGGVTTGRIDGGGTDAQAAAKADIDKAAKDSYGAITGHQELKSEAVKVNGQDGYLVRWKVDAPKGNNGYVQTVVFPSTDGKSLISVHFGFDIADKAPDLGLMDTIVNGIADFKGKLPSLPGGGLPGGATGGIGGTST